MSYLIFIKLIQKLHALLPRVFIGVSIISQWQLKFFSNLSGTLIGEAVLNTGVDLHVKVSTGVEHFSGEVGHLLSRNHGVFLTCEDIAESVIAGLS